MSSASIRATVVGSYPVPAWLRAYPTRSHLRDAVMTVLKTQELAGIDLVADGELYRFDVNHPETNGMIDYFIGKMSGVSTEFTAEEIAAFRRDPQMRFRARPAGVVRGPIGPGTLNLPGDYEEFRDLTEKPLKFTATGPHMLSKTLVDAHYGDRAAVADAIADVLRAQLAEIDAAAVQLDEANISGHPEEWEWAAPAVNRALEGVRGEKAVHICFGNYGGQSVQHGMYEALLPFMNALQVDHLVLEFARRGYGELETLRQLRPEIGVGLGVVDIKDNGVEDPNEIARRVESAAERLGPERIRYIHPDCGFWMLPRPVADGKMRALAEGRDLYLGV